MRGERIVRTIMSKNIPFLCWEDYPPIGKYLLKADTPDENGVARYKRDMAMKSFVLTKKGEYQNLLLNKMNFLFQISDLAACRFLKTKNIQRKI